MKKKTTRKRFVDNSRVLNYDYNITELNSCTVIGQKYVNITPELKTAVCKTILNLVTHQHIKFFFFGYEGAFELLVLEELRKLQDFYPKIMLIKFRNHTNRFCPGGDLGVSKEEFGHLSEHPEEIKNIPFVVYDQVHLCPETVEGSYMKWRWFDRNKLMINCSQTFLYYYDNTPAKNSAELYREQPLNALNILVGIRYAIRVARLKKRNMINLSPNQ